MDEEQDQEITPELVEELKQKAERVGELEAEIEKLKGKDYNFKQVSHKAEALEKEKKSLEERVTELEGLQPKIQSLEERTQKASESLKEQTLDRLAGTDKEMRKKIESEFKSFNGEPMDESDLVERLNKAYWIVEKQAESRQQVNPFNQYVPSTSGPTYPSQSNKKSFADTDEGKQFAKNLGLNLPE